MSANPHANGGPLLRDLVHAGLPRLRRAGGTSGRRGPARPPGVLGGFLRDIITGQPGPVPHHGPRRDGVQPARPPCSRRPTGPGTRRTVPGDDHLSPDGRVMEVLSEHLCQGWLEGYLLTGRHGLFNCYEAFIHIVDSMFNQHAKWLKTTRGIPWRAPIASLELPAVVARLAPGPQRLLPPGPGLHRPRDQQEGRDRPGLPAAGHQHPALGGRPLPAQPALRQRHRGRQAAGADLPDHRRGDRALHPRAGDLALGRQHRRRTGRRPGLRRRRPHPGDPGRRRPAAHPPARAEGPGHQRRGPHAAAAGHRAPARSAGPRLRRAVHHRQAGDLRLSTDTRG